MSWLEEKYIKLLSPKLSLFKQKSSTLFQLRCPICGDSQKDKYKARGYIYPVSSGYNFACHNCSASMSFGNFLRQVDSSLFREYKLEKFTSSSRNTFSEIKKEKKESLTKTIPFQKVSELPEDHIILKYLEKRKIPPDKRKLLYYTDNLSKIGEVYSKYKNTKLPKDKRLLLPILDSEKNLIGISARKILKSDELRYVLLRFSNEKPLIYNLENVDKTSRVYVFEGAIDSLFVNNSVAVDGSDFTKVGEYLDKEKCTLVFDNQPKNPEIVHKIKKMIDSGWNIVIWPESILEDGKDINELIKSGMTEREVKNIIDNNTFNGLKAQLQFAKWRLV